MGSKCMFFRSDDNSRASPPITRAEQGDATFPVCPQAAATSCLRGAMPLGKPVVASRRSTTASSRCRTCNNLDPRGHSRTVNQFESTGDAKAHLTLVLDPLHLSKAKATSEGGCRYCAVIASALDSLFEGWRGIRQKILVDLKEKESIKVSVENGKWSNDAIEIFAGSASRAPWPSLGTAHRIPGNAGSDDTFDFARRCIQDCLTNPKHSACNRPSLFTSIVPKRLLDVGRVGAPIRLIDTQGRSFDYACLSHCWGSRQTLMTTKSNWQKLVANIPFERMPPLFQDAIIITRQLGLRYLWIDSLCIIQDSTRDWETESSKMSGIYENGYVTISATNVGDSNGRCLTERAKGAILPYFNTSKKEFAIRARKIERHHPSVEMDEPAKPRGPLPTRAWVLQEHVLSTRILHYTSTELLFECKTSYRCECLPARKKYPTTLAMIPRAISQKNTKCAIWDLWQRLVEEYSQRALTVPTDKLPAISGIASKIKDGTHSGYVAGLWKDNLASDLLWSSSADEPQIHAPGSKFVAPSFSWASVDGPVSYYMRDDEERDNFKPDFSLLSSSVTLAGLSPLGAVSTGSIKVRGWIMSALLSSNQRDGKWEYALLIKGTSAVPVIPDCLLVEEEVDLGHAVGEKTVRRARSVDEVLQFKTAVKCLSIATQDNFRSALVLGVSSRVPGAWERVGTCAAGLEAFQKTEEDVIQIT